MTTATIVILSSLYLVITAGILALFQPVGNSIRAIEFCLISTSLGDMICSQYDEYFLA